MVAIRRPGSPGSSAASLVTRSVVSTNLSPGVTQNSQRNWKTLQLAGAPSRDGHRNSVTAIPVRGAAADCSVKPEYASDIDALESDGISRSVSPPADIWKVFGARQKFDLPLCEFPQCLLALSDTMYTEIHYSDVFSDTEHNPTWAPERFFGRILPGNRYPKNLQYTWKG